MSFTYLDYGVVLSVNQEAGDVCTEDLRDNKPEPPSEVAQRQRRLRCLIWHAHEGSPRSTMPADQGIHSEGWIYMAFGGGL